MASVPGSQLRNVKVKKRFHWERGPVSQRNYSSGSRNSVFLLNFSLPCSKVGRTTGSPRAMKALERSGQEALGNKSQFLSPHLSWGSHSTISAWRHTKKHFHQGRALNGNWFCCRRDSEKLPGCWLLSSQFITLQNLPMNSFFCETVRVNFPRRSAYLEEMLRIT